MAIVYQDTFEDTNTTLLSAHHPSPTQDDVHWTVTLTGSATAAIDNAQKISGDTSCKMVAPAASGVAVGTHVFTGQSGTFNMYVSFYTYAASALGAVAYPCRVYTYDTGGTKLAALIVINQLHIKYYNAGVLTDSLHDFELDHWYTIKLTINNSAKTFSAWITGGAFTNEHICTDASFYNASTWSTSNVGQVFLSAFNNGTGTLHTTWFDDWQVGDADPAGQPRIIRSQFVAGMKTYNTGGF